MIDEGKKGLLGVFGSKRAYVKVTEMKSAVDEGKQFLVDISRDMNVSVDVQVKEDQHGVVYDLVGEKLGLLIGKRGQTINALQYLTHLVVNKNKDEYVTVVVDAENYRAQEEKRHLKDLANKLANKAMKLNKEVRWNPMLLLNEKSHTALQDHSKVSTYSDGRDPNRYVVIKPE